jgi:hypothetical protein
MMATWGEERNPIVAEIDAMEKDPVIRRRAIQYSSRLSLYDLSWILARQDVERERSMARAVDVKKGDDDPATLADLLDCLRSYINASAWRQGGAVVLGALLLACCLFGCGAVGFGLWTAVQAVGR